MVTSTMGTPTSITVKCVERLTPTSVRVTLDPGAHAESWTFVPGGFLTFCLPCAEPALMRSYSLVQGPEDALPQVVVKEVRPGGGSAFINRRFHEGMQLMAYPPQGRMFPEAWNATDAQYVMFAAGMGITPLLSVIKHVLHTRQTNSVVLFCGNRSARDILLLEELETLNAHPQVTVVHVLSDGSMDEALHNGRIDGKKALELLATVPATGTPRRMLISGPEGMRQSVLMALLDSGIDPADVRLEDFTHPPHLDEPISESCEVHVDTPSGPRKFAFDPRREDLLDAMDDRGIDAPSSCRGGVCGNCQVKVLEGEVVVANNYALTAEERRQGWVLCCQAKPLTSSLRLRFKEAR